MSRALFGQTTPRLSQVINYYSWLPQFTQLHVVCARLRQGGGSWFQPNFTSHPVHFRLHFSPTQCNTTPIRSPAMRLQSQTRSNSLLAPCWKRPAQLLETGCFRSTRSIRNPSPIEQLLQATQTQVCATVGVVDVSLACTSAVLSRFSLAAAPAPSNLTLPDASLHKRGCRQSCQPACVVTHHWHCHACSAGWQTSQLSSPPSGPSRWPVG